MRYLVLLSLLVSVAAANAKDFIQFERTANVVEILVTEHGLDRDEVMRWMSSGVYRQASVSNLAAPAETSKSYVEYKPMFLASSTVRQGKEFREKYADLLQSAERTYGVPAEIIVAIIGIESRYGRSMGRHRTFDALGSLAVTEGRRADYFQREWIKFILIMVSQGRDPLDMKGSYAGASGYPQFMPTSYDAYAVDHNEDGHIDIWSDPEDAIGSVANYLKQNGWRVGEPILTEATVGQQNSLEINSFSRDKTLQDIDKAGWVLTSRFETDGFVFPVRLDTDAGQKYWLGYRNFWVISRYNRSIAYTMAVVELADAIRNLS
ncbi:MAG: lytic murein transglycosylase B [Reinekea sp.]|nr:lytic murein transglycosylase B [Reinekea sp.]